jgi:ribose 5-phosphate isomerase RpiB
MKIAVLNETSAADRNADILAALNDRGHEVVNVGMKKNGEKPDLQYIHTGFLSALLINAKRADLIVGGCGTGQGFLNAVVQYPGVICGHILNDLDAWLFAQINDGNVISLALNQGYGWAADVNLKFIFDRYFSVEGGQGYPARRREPQAKSRDMLRTISAAAHRPMSEIVERLPEEITLPALNYPGVKALLDVDHIEDGSLRTILKQKYSH